MGDTVLADIIKKKKMASAFQKGSNGKRKQKVDDMDDDTKLVALRDEAKKQASASKSKAHKSVSEIYKQGVGVKNMREEVGAEPKSTRTKVKAALSEVKNIKSAGMVKDGEGEDAVGSNILRDNEGDATSSTKRKRGADVEIVQAYLSSGKKALSRFRPRKEMPGFRMVELNENDNYRIVGKRVKVYWPGSRRWFTGRIQAFHRRKRLHSILYEDGDKDELDLTKERFELEIMRSEGFNLQDNHLSKKKVGAVDVTEVSTDVFKEASAKVGDAENAVKSSETQKKRAPKTVTKRRSSELEIKDIEVKVGGGSVSGLDADSKHENVDVVSSDELLVTKEPDEIISGKENDETKTIPEIANKSTGVLEAQAGASKIVTEVKAIGLEEVDADHKKNGEIGKHESDEKGTTKLVKKGASSRRIATAFTGRRKKNLLNKKVDHKKDKLDVEKGANVYHDEVMMNSMHGDIQGEEAIKDDRQMIVTDDGGVSLVDDAATSCQTIISLEANRSKDGAGDGFDRQAKLEIDSKDAVSVASNVEIAVLTLKRIEEKVTNGELQKEKEEPTLVSHVTLEERENATKKMLKDA